MRSSNIEDSNRLNKIILCKRRRVLNNKCYDVEVSINNGSMTLVAKNIKLSDLITVTIPEDKSNLIIIIVAKEILEAFNRNYELIIKNLHLVKNKLMIVGPSKSSLDKSIAENPKGESEL